MKKWKKALSAFVIATVMSTGVAATAGCGGGEKEHEHTYKTEWSSDANGHYHESTCGHENSTSEAHVDKLTNGTTTETPDGLCDVCDYKMEHKHTYKTEWSSNENGHYHESTCGHENSTPEAHVDKLTNGTTTETPDGLCDVCDYKVGDVKPPEPEVPTALKTKEDLLAFRQLGEVAEGDYTLEADIDLEGETLPASTVVLTGTATFNGKGHMIMNATYANADSKTGLLFKSIKGASVSDVKFLNCGVTSSNESVALLAGTVESGDATKAEETKAVISKIEFNSSVVNSTGNYGGLIYGRNEGAAYIEISEITTKNGTTVKCAQYGGFLTGDNIKTTVLKMKDLHLDGEFDSSSNGSFFAGRTRGSTVTIENAVIKAKITNDGNNGLFVGGSDKSSLTVKNVLILETNSTSLCKLGSEPATLVTDKLYSVGEAVTLNQSKATAETPATPVVTEVAENTVATLKDTLGLDFTNVWTEEGEGAYRLKAASTNVKSEGATLNSIKVSVANAKLRYKAGEESTTEGVLVMGVYSDGVQLVLTEGADKDYTVDFSGVDFNTAGKYNVTVRPNDSNAKIQEFEIVVASQTGIKAYDDRMSHVYLVGAKSLDTAYLTVKSTWTDGVEEILPAKDYTIAGADFTTVGEKTVTITNGTFTPVEIKINVINDIPVAVDSKVYVEVNKSVTKQGDIVKGVAKFSEVGEAIKYLEYSNLPDTVTKVIYIGEGTYNEHIKTSLKNLTLIGAGKDRTVITASNVQSTLNPLDDKAFGLKENATFIALGDNFQARGLSIRNDFDYPANGKKESGPQGTALMIGGDMSVISDCLLYGHQDTLYFSNGRVYLKNTEIHGNIDFIFGEAKGLAFFEECTIKAINKATQENPEKNNGYVTAMKADAATKPDYGYIFSKCNFTDDGTLLKGSMSLGRPWGPAATVAYLECNFSAAYSTLGYGDIGEDGKAVKPRWYDMSGNKPEDADFVEWKSTGEGAITTAVKGGSILTDEQAANYTKTNIFAKTNGKCEWAGPWNCDNALTALIAMDTARVEATDFAFEQYELDEETNSIKVEVGATTDFVVGVGPWNAIDKSISIDIEDTTIATFNRGVIKGIKEGETKITVSKDGFESVEIKVTVIPRAGTEKFDNVSIKASEAIDAGTIVIGEKQNIDNVTLAEGIVLNTTGNSTKVNAHSKTIGGIAFTHRIVMKGKGNYFAITTKGAATIKVYAGNGSGTDTTGRLLGLYADAAGDTLVAGTETTNLLGNELKVVEYTITSAGTFYLQSPTNELGIYGIEIIYPEVSEPTLENVSIKVTDAIAAGALTENSTAHNVENATIAEGIVLNTTGNKTKINAHAKEIGGVSFGHRVVLKGAGNYFAITTKGAATIKVYAGNGSSSDTTGRLLGLYSDTAGTALVAGTETTNLLGNELKVVEYTVTAGTFYLQSPTNELGIYGIDIIYS